LEELLFTALTLQAFYYLVVFSRLYFIKTSPKVENNKILPVSVIICARNEAENLSNNLSYILQQQYPVFEVVVINDASDDDTQQVIDRFKKQFSHLRTFSIPKEKKTTLGKKQALTLGIENARYEYLLLTDADCKPSSPHWVQSMSNAFGEKSSLVLGLAPYISNGSLLSNIIQYETAMTAIQYISYALWEMPYMGVGRNMAYTKTLFAMSGGFQSHLHIPSGDDDLMVQKAAKYAITGVCLDKDALMYSQPPTSWKSWFRQKMRHYSTGSTYQTFHRFFLGVFLMSKILMYSSAIALTSLNNWTALSLSLFVPAMLLMYFPVWTLRRRAAMPAPLLFTPVIDFLYTVLTISLGLIATFRKQRNWK
jgi:poly-beta-1,6-N-acetyl-D-glucosamine synthase